MGKQHYQETKGGYWCDLHSVCASHATCTSYMNHGRRGCKGCGGVPAPVLTRAQDWPLCERCGEAINRTLPGTPNLPDYAEARFCSEDCKLAAGETGQHSLFKLEG